MTRPIHEIEIRASTKVTGKRRIASIEAAKRKVRDGSLYLIRRHGGWFRPGAHGYTAELAGAGIFDAKTARRYLDVDGLSVVPAKSIIQRAKADLMAADESATILRALLAIIQAPEITNAQL